LEKKLLKHLNYSNAAQKILEKFDKTDIDWMSKCFLYSQDRIKWTRAPRQSRDREAP